jgi:uncharacterized membrane protein YhaH (DUF805 family)
MTQRRGSAASLLLPVAGFGLWAVAFVVLYGALSVGCRLGFQNVDLYAGLSMQRLLLLCLAIVFLAVHAVLVMRLRADPDRERTDPAHFLRYTAFAGSVAAFGASAFTFMGIIGLTTC